MFGRVLNETLGKIEFWTFIIGFHLTFFLQHFLGLVGMQRRVFTYLPNQGFDLMNMLSTVGAFLMGVGVILFLVNVVITARKPVGVENDPWETAVPWNGPFRRRRRSTTSSSFRLSAVLMHIGKRRWLDIRR